MYHLRKGLKGYSPFVTLIISQIFSPCVFPLMPQSCRVKGLVSKLAFVIFWIKSWTNNCLKKKRYVWKFFTISYLYMHWNKKKHSFRIQITIPSPFWEMKVTFAHPNVHLNLFCCVTYYSLSKKKITTFHLFISQKGLANSSASTTIWELIIAPCSMMFQSAQRDNSFCRKKLEINSN